LLSFALLLGEVDIFGADLFKFVLDVLFLRAEPQDVILRVRDVERVEVNLADEALVDKVVRSLQLPENTLRAPRFGPAVNDSSGVDHREAGVGAAARIEDADPALHVLAVDLEIEILPVSRAGFAF